MSITGRPAATDTRRLPPAGQNKGGISVSDCLRDNEKSVEHNKKIEHLQKQEFIRSEALKCEGNVCKVTPAGQNLLNPENKSIYAQKFSNFYNNPLINIQR